MSIPGSTPSFPPVEIPKLDLDTLSKSADTTSIIDPTDILTYRFNSSLNPLKQTSISFRDQKIDETNKLAESVFFKDKK